MRFRQEVQTVLWTEAVREELIDERRQVAVILQQSVQKIPETMAKYLVPGIFPNIKRVTVYMCVIRNKI